MIAEQMKLYDCRIDQIEDELIHEKLKIKAVSDDVDGTFKQMETGEVGR